MKIFEKYNLLSQSSSNKMLIEAVKINDFLSVEYLLTSKNMVNPANINYIDHSGSSALSYAIYNRNLDMVKFLIEDTSLKTHSNINQRDYDDEYNMLLTSICIKNYEITKYFLLDPQFKNKIDIHYQAKHGENALMLACRNGDLEIVKLLIEEDINTENSRLLDKSYKNDMNAFLWACRSNNLEVVKYLVNISNYDFIHQKDDDGNTALFHAYYRNCSETIDYLIKELKFDIYEKNKDNKNIFHIAYKKKEEQWISDLLIKYDFIIDTDTQNWMEDNKDYFTYEVAKSISQQKKLNSILDNKNSQKIYKI